MKLKGECMFIEVEKQGEGLSIQLNRPEKRNSFHPDMIGELTTAFLEAETRKDCKYIYLWGKGKSFCSGADLSWMKSMVDYSLEENLEDSKKLFSMFEAAYRCSLPIIGKAHGHVMGGALGLLAICDVVASESSTQFAFSEVNLGLAPAVISPFVLEKMTFSIANELMISGQIFTAQKAKDSGLIHYIGSESEVDVYLKNYFKTFSKVDLLASRETKKLLKRLRGKPILSEEVKTMTCQLISQRRVSESAQSRLRSFIEKRK